MQYHRSLKQIALARMRGMKTHDRFNAVDEVSFTVGQGESVGRDGPQRLRQVDAAQDDQRRHAARQRHAC